MRPENEVLSAEKMHSCSVHPAVISPKSEKRWIKYTQKHLQRPSEKPRKYITCNYVV